MEALPLEGLGVAGAVVAIVVALVLWKLFKLAFKVVVFVVVAATLAAVVALYLKGSRPALPIDAPTPAIPDSDAPR